MTEQMTEQKHRHKYERYETEWCPVGEHFPNSDCTHDRQRRQLRDVRECRCGRTQMLDVASGDWETLPDSVFTS